MWTRSFRQLAALGALALALYASPVTADQNYGPGVSDTEIRIGQTRPYSGATSAYSAGGLVQRGFFQKLNAEGGIKGRRIKLISLDDSGSPPKTVEQTRKLIEQEEVLLVFNSNGTACNSAVQKYLNAKRVPQLFVSTGATKFGDPGNFPWTMGWLPNYKAEAAAYAKYILKHHPDARIGVLYQNDDFGKDYLTGLKDGLGQGAQKMIVAEATYELTDPTVESQIIALKGAGANVFVDITTAKFAAQAIREAYDIGWKPAHFVAVTGSSIGQVIIPAGVEKSIGLITIGFVKDPTDPQWDGDPGMRDWREFMKKYYPGGDLRDWYNVYAYAVAQTLVEVLKRSGDDLTRENVMRQAANLKNLELPVLLPGIRINTSPTDYNPIKQVQLQRFDGKQWRRFGEVFGN